MIAFYRKFTAIVLAVVSFFTSLFTCTEKKTEFTDVNGSYVTVDELGRNVVSAGNSDKQVGIFYFLWLGEHGTNGPYDNTKIVASHPEAVLSGDNWVAAGGGPMYAYHFWGEPLFGYYLQKDTWVIRKHLQMLTDAGIDFVVFDTTNAIDYKENVKRLISVWYEYMADGWDVPKIAFYTNSESGQTMNNIYDDIYNNKELNEKYPQLDKLWFRIDDDDDEKPMIVGDSSDSKLRKEVKNYFRIKANQWPNEKKKSNGFPWIEFDRALTFDAKFKESLFSKSILNVSVAQHCSTIHFSATAWYGGDDHSRSWHDGKIDTSENAVLYGHNFEEQWKFANAMDPDIVFVTGWNEWIALRGYFDESEPILFCDAADTECSRDCEPSAGILGDNYYMQLVSDVAKFKGKTASLKHESRVKIDINGDFSQWENNDITAVYRDYKNDTADRDSAGYGELWYTDKTGRNDIVNAKVAEDRDNIYFYVDTSENLTSPDGGAWMNLLINTKQSDKGYNFCINRNAPQNGKTSVEKISSDNNYTKCADAKIKYENNKLMISVEKSDLGIGRNDTASFSFKWTDNCNIKDVFSFYKNGDSAPYGRLNFQY